MERYVLLKTILENNDIYNPVWSYKIRNIKTLQCKEVSQRELNKLIEDGLVINCSKPIK